MPRSTTEHLEESRGRKLLQEFDNSLPDFKSMDEEHHVKFVKAIRMLCAYLCISETRLKSDHSFTLRRTIVRLNELYEEYRVKDAILASAISIVKLHIESYYLGDQDAELVHNLTGLLTYPLNPRSRARGESAAV